MKLTKTEVKVIQEIMAKGTFSTEAWMERGRSLGFREYKACQALVKKGLCQIIQQKSERSSRITARIFGRTDGCIHFTTFFIKISFKSNN